MATKRVRGGWLLLIIPSVLSLTGCGGSNRLPVAGTVMLDGKPLNGVNLVFSPDTTKGNNAQISCTSLVTEGRYDLKTSGITRSDSGPGAPPGWYKVTVTLSTQGTRNRPQAKVEIPDKYLSVEKTTLEVEVKNNPEPGAYDLKLTK